jgi:hypothetical protein
MCLPLVHLLLPNNHSTWGRLPTLVWLLQTREKFERKTQ